FRRSDASLLAHRAKVARRPVARRTAPEHAEGFVEDRQVLMALDQQGLERKVEVGSASELNVLQGRGDVEHASRWNRQTERAQERTKAHQIPEKRAHRWPI